jgi:hypothetical protein
MSDKPYTPAEVIRWLRRFGPRKTFSWFNVGCGCLLTQFYRVKHRGSKALVGIDGRISGERIPTFGFHGRFWELTKVRHSTTAAEAIRILKTL